MDASLIKIVCAYQEMQITSGPFVFSTAKSNTPGWKEVELANLVGERSAVRSWVCIMSQLWFAGSSLWGSLVCEHTDTFARSVLI